MEDKVNLVQKMGKLLVDIAQQNEEIIKLLQKLVERKTEKDAV